MTLPFRGLNTLIPCGSSGTNHSLLPYVPSTLRALIQRHFSSNSGHRRYGDFHLVSQDEDVYFTRSVEKIEKKWQLPRHASIKRPYTAYDVATKQGTLLQSYPSSLMASKLLRLLQEKASRGEPLHTSMKRAIAFPPSADAYQWE